MWKGNTSHLLVKQNGHLVNNENRTGLWAQAIQQLGESSVLTEVKAASNNDLTEVNQAYDLSQDVPAPITVNNRAISTKPGMESDMAKTGSSLYIEMFANLNNIQTVMNIDKSGATTPFAFDDPEMGTWQDPAGKDSRLSAT
ncbi:MAG: hypothetical protein V1495_06685 [Pseudomonadota bacterium]